MTVYVFAGWPVGMAEDESPAGYLQDGAGSVFTVELDPLVSESLPECIDRIVIDSEAAALGVGLSSFRPDHVFGNGVSCALVRTSPDGPTMELSWVVTPLDSDYLTAIDLEEGVRRWLHH